MTLAFTRFNSVVTTISSVVAFCILVSGNSVISKKILLCSTPASSLHIPRIPYSASPDTFQKHADIKDKSANNLTHKYIYKLPTTLQGALGSACCAFSRLRCSSVSVESHGVAISVAS